MKSIETYFFEGGYIRKTSHPYTPLQNGVVEHKTKYIMEASLAMLMRSIIPIIYWEYNFKKIIHLINMLPSNTFDFSNPLSYCFTLSLTNLI